MRPMLGDQHPSKPVTDEDKSMSVRHLATRKRMDNMKPTADNLRNSIKYNEKHRDEHAKAIEERREDLEEAREEQAKLKAKIAKKRGK